VQPETWPSLGFVIIALTHLPAETRLDRLIRSTMHRHETERFTHVAEHLSMQTRTEIDTVLMSPEVTEAETSDTPSGPLILTDLKADPERIGPKTLLQEWAKLDRLRRVMPARPEGSWPSANSLGCLKTPFGGYF
jgi:hypothetical protein